MTKQECMLLFNSMRQNFFEQINIIYLPVDWIFDEESIPSIAHSGLMKTASRLPLHTRNFGFLIKIKHRRLSHFAQRGKAAFLICLVYIDFVSAQS